MLKWGGYSNFRLHSIHPNLSSFQQLTRYPVLRKSYATTVLVLSTFEKVNHLHMFLE